MPIGSPIFEDYPADLNMYVTHVPTGVQLQIQKLTPYTGAITGVGTVGDAIQAVVDAFKDPEVWLIHYAQGTYYATSDITTTPPPAEPDPEPLPE